MNILHCVEHFFPSVGGMQEAVRQISEQLSLLGHSVTIATSKEMNRIPGSFRGLKILEFDLKGNLVTGLSGNVQEYQKFLKSSNFDIVTFFAAQQAFTDLALDLIEEIPGKKVFVPTGFSGLFLKEYGFYFSKMADWQKKFDANVFLSSSYRDIAFAKKNDAKNCVVIPNGACEKEFSQTFPYNLKELLGIPKDHFLILLVASHTGLKGHLEAIDIFQKINISKSTLLLVGNSFGNGCSHLCQSAKKAFKRFPVSWIGSGWRQTLSRIVRNFSDIFSIHPQQKQLFLLDLSRRETIELFHLADLFLFPSNIECSPIVLFECIASKTPFLVTDVGNSIEIVRWTGGGEVLPTRRDSHGLSHVIVEGAVVQLESLISDNEKRKRMIESGYHSWQAYFTWEKIAQEYERLYFSLLQETPFTSKYAFDRLIHQ